MKRVLLLAVSMCGLSQCSGDPLTAPSDQPEGMLVGAGDIADCGSTAASRTAALLDRLSGTVFTAGDNVYYSGTASEFRECYEPTWGRHKSRTRPSPGNHDYGTLGAAPYFEYFGATAGPPGLGYYSYRVGSWLVLSLNSNVDVAADSAQALWLRGELAAFSGRCAVAYFHHPPFGSGIHGGDVRMREIWRILYDSGVDVVIAAHNHMYERFARQDADGRADQIRGVRLFVVGTGGGPPHPIGGITAPNSEVRAVPFGVLQLELGADSYDWEFIPAEGATFRDAGSNQCH